MKTLDKGQDKIKKICDTLRSETLEPAKLQAAQIIEEARERAEHIVAEGKAEQQKIIAEAHASIEQERAIFYSSLEQAEKQTLESLRQKIEHKLFDKELESSLAEEMGDSKVIARLVDALVTALDRDGISNEFSAIIPATVSPAEVSRYLLDNVAKRLQEAPIPLGEFSGGAQIKLVDRRFTLDISDKALCEFLKGFVRKDFRKWVFNNTKAH